MAHWTQGTLILDTSVDFEVVGLVGGCPRWCFLPCMVPSGSRSRILIHAQLTRLIVLTVGKDAGITMIVAELFILCELISIQSTLPIG